MVYSTTKPGAGQETPLNIHRRGGNGYYAQDVFYKMLNAGIDIVPSAGSASGVLMNPVGYNRLYAYVENTLTYEKWFESVRKGRTFITNGPMLICKADNQYPGYEFSAASTVKLKIDTEVFSRDSVESIEIIKNGKLYKTLSPLTHASEITFDKSGWFLVRVICNTPGNFRFASTAPYHVKIAGKKYISKIVSTILYGLARRQGTRFKDCRRDASAGG